MQVVIDCLAFDVVGVDLTHISAMGIVKGEEMHITNLLEIFDGLLEFVLEEFQKTDLEEQIVNKKHDKENQGWLYFNWNVRNFLRRKETSVTKIFNLSE